MKKHKIKIGKMKTVFNGKIFKIKQAPAILPSGEKTTFEWAQRPASVSILAFNDKNELLMIREHRIGYNKNVWFLPGGRVDKKGDTPRKAIIREMREESGYRAKTIKFVHFKSPGNTLIWNIHIFAGKNLVYDPLPPEDGEYAKPIFMPFQKAVKMALNGEIENEFIAYNIIRFDYLMKHGGFRW